MKLTYPADAPFAVEVPDLAAAAEPGETIDIADGVLEEHVASLLVQGWEPADTDARQVAKKLERLAKAGFTGTIEERALFVANDGDAELVDGDVADITADAGDTTETANEEHA